MYKLSRIINGGTQTISRTVSVNASTKVVNKVNEQVKPWREIPGPLSLPIIGQFLHFLPGGWLYKRTIELQGLLYKQYGPIVRIDGAMGFPPITFIFDPVAVLNLFRKEDTNPFRPGLDSMTYYRKHYYNKNDDDPLGLILGNNENWKKFRSTVNPVMLHTKTIKQYANVMAEVADDMVKRMKLLRNKNNMLEGNFYLDLNLWALESIAVVALGSRLNCFDPNLAEDSPVKKLIDNVHGVFNTLEKLDFQPNIWKYIATPEFKKGMQVYENNAKINEFFIDKAVSELSKRKTNDSEKSVLEKLLDIDRDVAILMAHDMLLAGVDTSASTVLGALYLLATNPEKQNKLREEVMLKENKRTYLKACIKESLRIFPILSGNFRKTMKEHEVLGYRIPKDMTVIAGNQQLCMMEEQFPRPTEFIPERWIVDKNDPLYYGNAHPFAFSPFGFGVRSCIGRRIAELEIETFLTKVIENFKIDWFGPMPKRVRKSTINYIEGPYNFIFKDV